MIRYIIAAAVAMPAVAAAQPAVDAPRTTFGLKAGINLANMSADTSEGELFDFDTKTALAVTAFAQLGMTPVLSLRPEIALAQRGATVDLMELGGEGSVDFDMLYADANLLVVATIPIEGDVKPYVILGPSMGLLLSAESTTSIDGGGAVETEDFKDEVNDLDVSVVAGGGVDIATGSGAVSVELRYQHGLRNLIPEDEAADGDSITHRVFSINLGYAF